MKVFVFVKMFQGIVDDVRVFVDEKKAIKAFNDFTEEDYEALRASQELWENFHQHNDNYSGTKIYETEVEGMGEVTLMKVPTVIFFKGMEKD